MEPYPLTWPVGYRRNPRPQPHNGFRQHKSGAYELTELLAELRRLKANEVVVSFNVRLLRSGARDWDARQPEDKGVAAYFKLDGVAQVLCCDAWDKVIHNLRALTKTIEDLRGIDRHQCSEILKRAFSGLKELPEAAESLNAWWEILNVDRNADPEHIKSMYRTLARGQHPDRGGDTYQFTRLTEAYEKAKRERRFD